MSDPAQQKDKALELFVVLSRAYNWVNAHAIRDIRCHGLNPTEFGILEALYHKGPLPLQQVGEKVLISSGNITYVVDKLEQRQLLPVTKTRASATSARIGNRHGITHPLTVKVE